MSIGSFQFPRPGDSRTFERWCLLLYREHLPSPDLRSYRRAGDGQHGIDLIGTQSDGRYVAVQCKARSGAKALSLAEIKRDVAAAEGLPHPIARLIFATTDGSNRHEDAVKALSAARTEAGRFAVEIDYWSQLTDILNAHEGVRREVLGDVLVDRSAVKLPERNGRFAGRMADLDRLHELLMRQGSVGVVQQTGLHAQGGVGKTSVALEYAWRCLSPDEDWSRSYPGGVFWIDCDTDDITSRVAGLARQLGIRDVFQEQEAASAWKSLFESAPASLLVLDNVRDGAQWTEAAFVRSLPGAPCRRLITTRAERLAGVEPMLLEGLTREDGIELLGRYREDALSEANREVAGDIVEWFNGLAVGLAVTGVYLQLKPRLTWQEFARQLDERGLGHVRAIEGEIVMRQGGGRVLPDYEKRVDVVFDEALSTLSRPERRALEYAALLPADRVPSSWLQRLVVATEDDAGEWVVERLCGLGLLSSSESDHHTLGLHRVLRARIEELLDQADREELLARIADHAGERASELRALAIDARPAWELTALLDVARCLLERGKLRVGLELANLLHHSVLESGRVLELKALLQRCVQFEATYLAADANVRDSYALLLNNLGSVSSELREREQARSWFERSLEVALQDRSSDDPELASRFNNVSLANYEVGEYRRALELSRRAIALQRRQRGAGVEHLARMFSNAVMIWHALDHPARAVVRARRALELFSRGASDPLELARVKNNLAMALSAQRDFTAALAAMQEAVAHEEQVLGAEHIQLADTYGNLAYAHQTCGNLASAESWYQKALDLLVPVYGFGHAKCLQLLCNLTPVLVGIGKLKAARSAIEQALETLEVSGRDHPHAGAIHLNAAVVYSDLRDFDRAVRHAGESIRHEIRIHGESSSGLTRPYANLGEILFRGRVWEEAARAWQRAIEVESAQPVPDRRVLAWLDRRIREAEEKAQRGDGEDAG